MTQSIEISEQSIVNYGVSEHLKAEFDMLRDVYGHNNHVKFSAKTVDTLAQHLVCRHYGNLCYEFSHLNWALVFLHTQTNTHKTSGVQHALLDFYWLSKCQNAHDFTSYFGDLCEASSHANNANNSPIAVTLNQGAVNKAGDYDLLRAQGHNTNASLLAGITLTIHGHHFTINATRANLLACFMEWLICVVPNILSLIETTLLGKGHNAIREFSSVLQKHIYDYLSQHLPTAKLQLRFRLMQSFYQQNAQSDPSQTIKSSVVNDETVLNFWRAHNTQEGYGKYSWVVKDSLAFKQALQIVQAGLSVEHANDIDASFESISGPLLADIDGQSHSISTAIFTHLGQLDAQYSIDVKCLAEKPKVLSKQQVEWLELAARYPQFIVPLSATWLRTQVFGKAQHQIIQLVRMRRLQSLGIKAAADYTGLCEQHYEQTRHECISLLASNQQTLLAIVDILLPTNSAQACLVLLKLMNTLPTYEAHVNEFSLILDEYFAVQANQSIGITAQTLSQWQLRKPWFNDVIKQCRVARKHINREGFTTKTLLEPEHYARCAQPLFDLNKLLKQLVSSINKHQQHGEAKFEADRLIFTSEFYALYSQNGTKDE